MPFSTMAHSAIGSTDSNNNQKKKEEEEEKKKRFGEGKEGGRAREIACESLALGDTRLY